ncbi:MAG TPA: VPLPA-CTERM sorting domain-containing protein [Gammaproteobacteria bacterium]
MSSVTNYVSFSIGDSGHDLDIFNIRSYGLEGELLDSRTVSGTSFFTVELLIEGIHSVEIDFDDTNEYGYYLDDLSFSTPSPVPLPSAAWLFYSGLIGLVGFARRKKLPQ